MTLQYLKHLDLYYLVLGTIKNVIAKENVYAIKLTTRPITNMTKTIYRETLHEKSYCYLKIVDLLGKMTSESDKTKRTVYYTMIMEEIKHIV